MSVHTDYKPRKAGLYDSKIRAEKHLRHFATVKARKEVKRDILAGLNGGKVKTATGALLLKEIYVEVQASEQFFTLSYSDRGDFTNCYRGGFY